MAKKRVSYFFDIELIEKIKEQSKHEGRSQTSFLMNAVRWYMDKVETIVKDSSGSAGVQPEGDDDRP